VYRDRPRLQFLSLLQSGILSYWATTLREAREQFERLPFLDAVVIDVENNVERGLEFCDIVHVNKPSLPIVFVRSMKRVGLAPHCAHRILAAEIPEDILASEILDLIDSPPSLGSKNA
jgi:CheY-like chemotaxis protein